MRTQFDRWAAHVASTGNEPTFEDWLSWPESDPNYVPDHEDEGPSAMAMPYPDGEPATPLVVISAWVFALGLLMLGVGAIWGIGALIFALS